MLTITNRPCHIGNSVSLNTEKHGEEDVGAIDIPLDGIMLEREELNALLQDPKAHDSLFRRIEGNGEVLEPAFRQLKAFAFKDHFEDASVTLTVGLSETEIIMYGCKVRRIVLEPQVGGMTAMSCMIRGIPDDADTIASVFGFMNHDADVEIDTGKLVEKGSRKQGELPMNSIGEGEQEEHEPETEGVLA